MNNLSNNNAANGTNNKEENKMNNLSFEEFCAKAEQASNFFTDSVNEFNRRDDVQPLEETHEEEMDMTNESYQTSLDLFADEGTEEQTHEEEMTMTDMNNSLDAAEETLNETKALEAQLKAVLAQLDAVNEREEEVVEEEDPARALAKKIADRMNEEGPGFVELKEEKKEEKVSWFKRAAVEDVAGVLGLEAERAEAKEAKKIARQRKANELAFKGTEVVGNVKDAAFVTATVAKTQARVDGITASKKIAGFFDSITDKLTAN